MNCHSGGRLFLVLLLALFPATVMASDFNVLWVGLGTLLIACLQIAIGIKASLVARVKARGEVVPYLLVIILLSGIGSAMVFDEKDHMSSLDTWGMFGTVLVPGTLSLLIPLLLSSSTARGKSDADE